LFGDAAAVVVLAGLPDIGRTLGIIGPAAAGLRAPWPPFDWLSEAPRPGPTLIADEAGEGWVGIVPGRETRPAPKITAAVTTAAEPPAIAPATGFERVEAPFSPDTNGAPTAATALPGNDPSAARPIGTAPKTGERRPLVDRASARRATHGSHSAR